MIGIRLMGGLGNQLFQIATGQYWRSLGHDVVYTNMDENLEFIANNYTPKRNADVYKGLFPCFNWDAYKGDSAMFTPCKVPFTFTEIEPQQGIEYVGYFQSERYFPNRGLIQNLFQWADFVYDIAETYYPALDRTCSIHVRRQDYLKLSDYHTVLDMEYYGKAIWTMKPFKIEKYLVFSDDMEWCKENFVGDQFVFPPVNEYVAMCMMSLCDHNILANSSLSWWGAYLGGYENKVVIAPEKWFGVKGENPKDLIPIQWIKL